MPDNSQPSSNLPSNQTDITGQNPLARQPVDPNSSTFTGTTQGNNTYIDPSTGYYVEDPGGILSHVTGFNQAGVPISYSTGHQGYGTYTVPGSSMGSFIYADPNAYQDPQNQQTIYNLLNRGFTSNAMMQSPTAAITALGNISAIQNQQDQLLAGGQNQYINNLYAQSLGKGPSLAAEQARQTAQQNIAGQMGILGSQRGSVNPALAMRASQMAGSQANQQAAQQAVAGRIQEQLNAQQQLGGALGTARSQGQAIPLSQAQLNQQAALQQGSMNQQTALANLTAAGEAQKLKAQQYLQLIGAGQQQYQTDISDRVALQQQLGAEELGIGQMNTGNAIAQQAQSTGLAGAGFSAGGAILAGLSQFSDETLKRNIKSGDRSLRSFLIALRGK